MNIKNRKRRRKLAIKVVILQNGSILAERAFTNRNDSIISMSSKSDGRYRIWIPCYQFYDNEKYLVEVKHGKVFLKGFLGCHGVGTSKGEFVKLHEKLKEDDLLELEIDDYASFGYKDLRILIKIAEHSREKTDPKDKLTKGYMLPFYKILIDHPLEKMSFAFAFLASALLIGPSIAGLILNKFYRPKDISSIPNEYVLPFIASEYVLAAPELLKERLNVKNIPKDIIGFNSSVVDTLIGIHHMSPHVPSNTKEAYNTFFKAQREEILNADEMQKSVDLFQKSTPEAKLVVIPTVRDETLNGTISRVLDKVDLIIKSSNESLKLRRKIVEDFKADSPHIYEEYQNIGDMAEKAEALKQIKPWNQMTTEDQLYSNVQSLSKKAAKKKNLGSMGHNYFPIGMTPGSKFATFNVADLSPLDVPLDTKMSGSKLSLAESHPKNSNFAPVSLDSTKIETFIKNHKYQLQICYEIALRSNDMSEGTMEWKWKVDPKGRIFDVSLVATNINNEKMARCIRDKISQWKFPPPRDGIIEISFPFEFSPTKG